MATACNARYDPDIFPAAVYYDRQSMTSSQIFSTGRVVVVGCSDVGKGNIAMANLMWTLYELCDIDTTGKNFEQKNIVAVQHLGMKINISLLYKDLQNGHMPQVAQMNKKKTGGPAYHPDRFPGLSWTILDPFAREITIVAFENGHWVLTGLSDDQQRSMVRDWLETIDISQYELGNEYRQLPEEQRHTVPKSKKVAK